MTWLADIIVDHLQSTIDSLVNEGSSDKKHPFFFFDYFREKKGGMLCWMSVVTNHFPFKGKKSSKDHGRVFLIVVHQKIKIQKTINIKQWI